MWKRIKVVEMTGQGAKVWVVNYTHKKHTDKIKMCINRSFRLFRIKSILANLHLSKFYYSSLQVIITSLLMLLIFLGCIFWLFFFSIFKERSFNLCFIFNKLIIYIVWKINYFHKIDEYCLVDSLSLENNYKKYCFLVNLNIN